MTAKNLACTFGRMELPTRMGIALGRVGFGGVEREFWCGCVEFEISGYLRGDGKEKCESWAGNMDLEDVDISGYLTPRAG